MGGGQAPSTASSWRQMAASRGPPPLPPATLAELPEPAQRQARALHDRLASLGGIVHTITAHGTVRPPTAALSDYWAAAASSLADLAGLLLPDEAEVLSAASENRESLRAYTVAAERQRKRLRYQRQSIASLIAEAEANRAVRV